MTILALAPLLDDFNRPDENPLAGGWLTYPNCGWFAVVAGMVVTPVGSSGPQMYWTTIFPQDQEGWLSLDVLPVDSSMFISIRSDLVNGQLIYMDIYGDGSGDVSVSGGSGGATFPPNTFTVGDICGIRAIGDTITVLRSRLDVIAEINQFTTDVIQAGYLTIGMGTIDGVTSPAFGPIYGGAALKSVPVAPHIPTPEDDTPWFDADRFVDPRDAPGEYFRAGVFDAQHGVKIPKVVDPLYQANYDEGFAFGTKLDSVLSRESM